MSPTASSSTQWISPAEAAGRIHVSVEFIYDACATKGLPHVRLCGRRNIRIRPERLDEWMLQFEVEYR